MATRNYAVAGAFYPADKSELSSMVDKFLKQGKENSGIAPLENIHGLIVPHAGYPYSGHTAGKAYAHIIGKKFRKAIILCPNHTLYLNKVAADVNDSWKTPLGELKVDTSIYSELEKISRLFVKSGSAHLKEHAIEVQIPFLQKTLSNFKIIPLVVGTITNEEIKDAARAILKVMDRETLLVISTDLSHFRSEREAEHRDSATIKSIISAEEHPDIDACGSYALKILGEICRIKKWKPKLVEYTNSGKVTGDHSRVVGYAGFWF